MLSTIKPKLRKFDRRSFWRGLLYTIAIPGFAYIAQELPSLDLLPEQYAVLGSLILGQIIRSVEGSFGAKD